MQSTLSCMSAKICARPVLGAGGGPSLAKCAFRRGKFLSTTCARKAAHDNAGGPTANPSTQPRWSSRNLFAVAATAAIFGWGLSNWQQHGPEGIGLPGFGRPILLDSRPRPHYGTMSEMKQVRFPGLMRITRPMYRECGSTPSLPTAS